MLATLRAGVAPLALLHAPRDEPLLPAVTVKITSHGGAMPSPRVYAEAR